MLYKTTRQYISSALVVVTALALATFGKRGETAPTPAQSEVRFNFDNYAYRVSEGDGGLTVTVVRTGDTSGEASVNYLADITFLFANGCGYPTVVGSATPGEDFVRAAGTLRFAAGETRKTFRVSVIDDSKIESRQPETVFLSLDFSGTRPPQDGICYGSSATLFIHENDPPPTPAPAPSNQRKIAFGSNRDGNYEIYVMNEDGTGVGRLTNTLAFDGQPSWSPDGTRLAFISDRDGSRGIFLMNSDGTNVTKLAGLVGENPVWSPDGTRLAFTGRGGSSADIFVVNIDGSAAVNVTNDPHEDFGPAWSPDGTRLAFSSRRDNGTFSVYVVNVDGTGTRRIVEGYSREPAWSPDGTRIAYVAQGDQFGGNIYVVNADGTGKNFLSGDRPFTYDVSPAWSPDGARILFLSNRDGDYEIYVMNADGTGQTRLTDNSAEENFPVWQPKTTFAFSAPTLLTEPNTSWALALDSVTHVAAPFASTSSTNYSPDGCTRLSLFAAGVTSSSTADVSVEAEDSTGKRYQLPVEHVAPVPSHGWITQINVRLPEGLAGRDYVWVTIKVSGATTNKAVITIENK